MELWQQRFRLDMEENFPIVLEESWRYSQGM